MEIELIRNQKKKWGVDGILRVNGKNVCDTVEHPTCCLPSGEYEVTIRSNPFRRGDGPMRSVNGEIIVGHLVLSGLVTDSRDVYERLYDRLKKEWRRGHAVRLIVM